MGVICFASLKGGVGKTSLSLNTAGAFAKRGCETLLIDLDPSGHSSRYFQAKSLRKTTPMESPLARLFLSGEIELQDGEAEGYLENGIVEGAHQQGLPMILPVRPRFGVLPAGPELRHFLWGKAARNFKVLFPQLIEELRSTYDYIIIDTPPDYNVLTRNAVASSDMVVVPVDASAMSIDCLDELVRSCAHIKGPRWSIIRTMVNRQASRIQKLSTERLHETVDIKREKDFEEEELVENLEDADRFISMLEDRETPNANGTINGTSPSEGPIYLLNSMIYRTEQQNKLSFLGRTAFDTRATQALAEQYSEVARELEEILSLLFGEEESNISVAELISQGSESSEPSENHEAY